MTILGIETSCDETAAAVLEEKNNKLILRSNIVASSLALHAKTGGIIPEIAARQQLLYIIPVIKEAIRCLNNKSEYRNSNIETNINFQNINVQNVSDFGLRISDLKKIDAIAVTYGPGLIGSLLVGVETAKTLAFVLNKPLIPVDHMLGHIYANWIDNEQIEFPVLALVISGGHSDLLLMRSHTDMQVLGGTRDDAAGEAFDKIGRMLGFPYPAGPTIERLAKTGDSKRFQFPRPLIGSDDFDFSFSGLKTAVLRQVQKLSPSIIPSPFKGEGQGEGIKLDEQTINDICRATQDAIIAVLIKKTLKAAKKYNVKSLVLSGGVAANQTLKEAFILTTNYQLPTTKLFVPTKSLCTDNGAMIAAAAFYHQKAVSWKEVTANPELYYETKTGN